MNNLAWSIQPIQLSGTDNNMGSRRSMPCLLHRCWLLLHYSRMCMPLHLDIQQRHSCRLQQRKERSVSPQPAHLRQLQWYQRGTLERRVWLGQPKVVRRAGWWYGRASFSIFFFRSTFWRHVNNEPGFGSRGVACRVSYSRVRDNSNPHARLHIYILFQCLKKVSV